MSRLRDRLRELIEPKPCVEQQSGSAQLAAYARDVRQAHQEIADRRDAAAAAVAAPPAPATLVEELKQLIGEPEQHDVPGLADPRLLQIAAGSQDAPRSVREELSGLLREMWDKREQPK
jgi:hypothetical protein